MKYALFQGCNIPIRIQQYATATTAIFKKFNIQLEEVPDFNCCGYPARNVDEKAYIIPSVRNMAIAEKKGLDIIVICNCCFASLQKTKNVIDNDDSLKSEINGMLVKEGLEYKGTVEINHYLAVLHEVVTLEEIKKGLTGKFTKLNCSVIHGCHILRPREITQFDDSFVPTITDKLMNVIGATSTDWRGKLECCGAALAGINDDLSKKLLQEKLDGAVSANADFIIPICSYCYLQFDTTQFNMCTDMNEEAIPVLLYPQLLGLCLGINEKELGINLNTTITNLHIKKLHSLIGPPVEEKKKRRKKKKVAEPA